MATLTGSFVLDWAISALSLFNILVLLWLGLTVLLNGAPPGALARHRGVWLMSGGLVAGALFFVCHIAILGQASTLDYAGLNFWWRMGWLPVLIVPYIWYVVVLWYGGYWEHARGPLRHRHRYWLLVVSLSMALLGLVALALQPLPPYQVVALQAFLGESLFRHTPLLFLLFPLVMVACVALSIDVLLRPAQGKYPITEHARKRSRPWLLATAVMLLTVSLLVIYILARLANGALLLRPTPTSPAAVGLPLDLARLDLLLSGMLALASLLLGQAIVSYEIFTGRVLPRRTFSRHWRSVVILAAGYATVVAWSLSSGLPPIYSLLLTTVLIATFFALYSWRSFLEHEHFIGQLRPFVHRPAATTSAPGREMPSFAADLFRAMCRNVLNATRAQLIPQGSAAFLAGPPLRYSAVDSEPFPDAPLAAYKEATQSGIEALQPSASNGYAWAIPLWSDQERVGTLLLAEKLDRGLYSQEEIEIAQATGERIVAMLSSEQMARRLMEIESKRVRQQRIHDIQMRRNLHDDILPMLHLAALRLNALQASSSPGSSASGQSASLQDAVQAITNAHRQIATLLADRQAASGMTRWNVDGSYNLADSLKGMLAAEFTQAFDGVHWQQADAIHLDGYAADIVLGAAREVIRNAALHGRGEEPDRPLHLFISLHAGNGDAQLIVEDDGIGLAGGTLAAGPARSGSGSGLTLHGTMLAIVGGSLAAEARPGGGTRATIRFPQQQTEDGANAAPRTARAESETENGPPLWVRDEPFLEKSSET